VQKSWAGTSALRFARQSQTRAFSNWLARTTVLFARNILIPRHDDDGSSRVLDLVLGLGMSEPDDLELRRQEGTHED